MAAPVVKLKKDDEFVFTLKYGNFTRTKHGFSIDGEIIVKDGVTAPEARLYINRDIRDLIAADWPGRDGSFRAVVLGDGSNATWKMIEVHPDAQNANYDPEVRAWNDNTNSFETTDWDDTGDGPSGYSQPSAESVVAPAALPGKALTPSKTATPAKAETGWGDLVSTAQYAWDAAGTIMGVSDDVPPEKEAQMADARYKMAYTLYADARKMGILPAQEKHPLDDGSDVPDEVEDPADEDGDLPF